MAEKARVQQVQRSARDAGVCAKDIRRGPQTKATSRRREAATKQNRQRRLVVNKFRRTCRCDGIGRRSGLKIHRWRQRTGSSPVTGTKKEEGGKSLPLLFCCRCPDRLERSESLGSDPTAACGGAKGGERVAAVGVQRSPAVGKAHTGHRNRPPAPINQQPHWGCCHQFNNWWLL